MELAMLTVTEFAGFAGAGLTGAAYVPQISHLIRARCSSGISRMAFGIWLLASFLTTARAIAIHAGVFIALGGIQIVAIALIMLCATWYKDMPCPLHQPRQPTAKTATETEPRQRGRSLGLTCRSPAESAAPVGHIGDCANPCAAPIHSVIARSRREPDAQAGLTPRRRQ